MFLLERNIRRIFIFLYFPSIIFVIEARLFDPRHSRFNEINRDRSSHDGEGRELAEIPRRYALSVEIVSGGIEISQRVNDTACRAHSSALIRSKQGGAMNALSAVLYGRVGRVHRAVWPKRVGGAMQAE